MEADHDPDLRAVVHSDKPCQACQLLHIPGNDLSVVIPCEHKVHASCYLPMFTRRGHFLCPLDGRNISHTFFSVLPEDCSLHPEHPCALCTVNFSAGDRVVEQFDCNHFLHKGCLRWLEKVRVRCPVPCYKPPDGAVVFRTCWRGGPGPVQEDPHFRSVAFSGRACSRCDRPYVAGDKVSVLVPCEHVLHTACSSRQFDFSTASHGSATELVLRWPDEVRDEIKGRLSEGHACPICLNKCVLGHPVVVFACKHFIHPNCYWSLVEGTNGRPRCPLDRSEIYSTAYIVTAAESKASGAFILTRRHYPRGPHEDFGIKYNMENGGPAPEAITGKISENMETIREFLIAEDLSDVDLSVIGITSFASRGRQFYVEVFDSAYDYVELMKSIFDFKSIRKLLSSPKFTFCYDALHGVAGPYVKRIFLEELGADESSLMNCVCKEDFGGWHLDPGLTNASDLLARMGLGKRSSQDEPPQFGAATDGDANHNMIVGKRFFVSPSDSVAIIAANAGEAIPYFSGVLKGFARSMITSCALDIVAPHQDVVLFEVPTGWKFFSNLMDAGCCSIWGDESFGTGSDHIREKDGIWPVLAWLSILAYKNKDKLEEDNLVTVEDIVREHWTLYGRHYCTRYDYVNVGVDAAKELLAYLVNLQRSGSININRIIRKILSNFPEFSRCDEFEYEDPVDGSHSNHLGFRFWFQDGSKLIFCISGGDLEGATIQLYMEQYSRDLANSQEAALSRLVTVALKLSKIKELTGRSDPSSITYGP
ncbi:hypothetical protein RHGRI_020540 [Rhododendron griersonianum]|uniref:phosphoglucomutase (alpha-D-glucose-1,6-bisphosphate-dependent) n=1 Tax=Rhododendron griersonianum TaxID=479676 RepID=A0AAV6JK27_9ERIC|nr:hypothetical protein RHGRI_020540 [Rhododendron griersonianum]